MCKCFAQSNIRFNILFFTKTNPRSLMKFVEHLESSILFLFEVGMIYTTVLFRPFYISIFWICLRFHFFSVDIKDQIAWVYRSGKFRWVWHDSTMSWIRDNHHFVNGDHLYKLRNSIACSEIIIKMSITHAFWYKYDNIVSLITSTRIFIDRK